MGRVGGEKPRRARGYSRKKDGVYSPVHDWFILGHVQMKIV